MKRLSRLPRELVSKVEVVTTVTSSETLIGLAKISSETRVVAWTISNRFMENLLWQIRDLENINIVKTFVSDKERDEIGESLSNAGPPADNEGIQHTGRAVYGQPDSEIQEGWRKSPVF